MVTPVLRPLRTGEVLDVSFAIYRNHFAALFSIAAATMLLPALLGLLIDPAVDGIGNALALLGAQIIRVVLMNLGIASCTLLVSRNYLGYRMTASEALHQAIPLIGRLVAISMLTGLAFAFGLVLLIIPGLILLMGYMLSSAVAVIEAPITATGAMRRSWHLTRGFRGRLFVAVMIPVMLLMTPMLVIGMVAGLIGQGDSRAMEALIAFGGVFFYPFLYVVIAVFYYDMRVRKEGLDLELLAGEVTTT